MISRRQISIILFSMLIWTGCFESGVRISANDPALDKQRGVMLYNGQAFTGSVYSLYRDGSPKSETSFQDGRRQGVLTEWYPNGEVRSVSHFHNGVREGEQKEWYRDGTPARVMQFENGRQSGRQIGWKENGDLRFKYSYRDGKRYGFMGSALCQAPE